MSEILFEKSISFRNPPKNLITNDTYLFNHELKREIKSSYIFFEKNVYTFNKNIFSLRKFKYFKKYSFFGDKNLPQRLKIIIKSFLRSSKNIQIIENGSWIIDNKSHVYFHWIFDALERSELINEQITDYPLLIPEEFYKKEFVSESLEHLKHKFIILRKNQVYKIKNLLITSKTALTGNYNEEILEKLIERFKNNSVPNQIESKKNIFIYRDSKIGRNIENFEEIKPILDKHKYEVVDFENYTFSEKVSLLSGCESLIGLFGSGLSNMIFLDKGKNLIEIRREDDSKNNAFFSLASACGLDYYYLFFELNNQGCFVDSSALDNLLEKLK